MPPPTTPIIEVGAMFTLPTANRLIPLGMPSCEPSPGLYLVADRPGLIQFNKFEAQLETADSTGH